MPACLASMASIIKLCMRLPRFSVKISKSGIKGCLFKVQITETGKSPPDMVQCTDTGSPKFKGSSPKSKGVILGGTFYKMHSVWETGNKETKKKKSKQI